MNVRAMAGATPMTKAFGKPSAPVESTVEMGRVDAAIERGRRHLLALQRPDGHWCGELEGDTILESEYVLLQAFLERLSDPKITQCANYLLSKQGDDGGWSNYPGGPADISVSVKAYFALKLAGYRSDDEPMRRARFAILEMGGAENVNSFTRYYLAMLGQIPYAHCPSVPPELALLPKWFPVNLYAMSSWTRTIVVPLSIMRTYQPVTRISSRMGVAELFRSPPLDGRLPKACQLEGRLASWPNFFRVVDRCLKICDSMIPLSFRRRAIKAAEKWMIDRFEGSDGLGAIFPPMVYTIVALRCLGYSEESAEVRWAEKQLDDLIISEGDSIRIQPCVSPVWDTTLSMIALGDAGQPVDHPSLQQAADWLLEREIREPGDWSVRDPRLEPSGWAFEYNNRFYPDLDDTAMALMALRRTGRWRDERCQQAADRALRFLLAMQGKDFGWAAFDRDVNQKFLEAIPFADHNAMLDPSCPDITARVLEMLGQLGERRGKPCIDNAIGFLFSHQEPEGCWYGRWGVNYIYGTWQALLGLASIGYDLRHPRVRKAVDWLRSVQNADGGWGESCASYADRSLMGHGPSTPSQTAWAVGGLIAAGEAHTTSVERGIDYLLNRQEADGGWAEDAFTGTGFPKVFYLKYHYYRLYFPLMTLARYRSAVARRGGTIHARVGD